MHPGVALTSEKIAESIQTNPAYVRQLMSALGKGGLLVSVKGHPRSTLSRDPEQITLLDAYRAVDGEKPILHQDTHTNPACGVGVNIQLTLADCFQEIQAATHFEKRRNGRPECRCCPGTPLLFGRRDLGSSHVFPAYYLMTKGFLIKKESPAMLENVKKKKPPQSGSIALLHISVMLFGFSAVLGQFVNTTAVVIAGGRVVFSSLILLIVSLAVKSGLKLSRKKDYGIALFTGVILAIHWTAFFQSIQSSSVAIGTITFSAFPLFLTFLEPLVFREKLRFHSVLSAMILLLGVGITVPAFSLENETTVGIVWGLISALAYAAMSLSNRYLSRFYESRTICLYEQGTAAVVLLPAFFLIKTCWTVQNIAGIAAIGLVCTALAHSLYVAAQRNVKAQTAGVISGMETVYGILFAFLFLREAPGFRELIGGVVILGAAFFSSIASSNEDALQNESIP